MNNIFSFGHFCDGQHALLVSHQRVVSFSSISSTIYDGHQSARNGKSDRKGLSSNHAAPEANNNKIINVEQGSKPYHNLVYLLHT